MNIDAVTEDSPTEEEMPVDKISFVIADLLKRKSEVNGAFFTRVNMYVLYEH